MAHARVNILFPCIIKIKWSEHILRNRNARETVARWKPSPRSVSEITANVPPNVYWNGCSVYSQTATSALFNVTEANGALNSICVCACVCLCVSSSWLNQGCASATHPTSLWLVEFYENAKTENIVAYIVARTLGALYTPLNTVRQDMGHTWTTHTHTHTLICKQQFSLVKLSFNKTLSLSTCKLALLVRPSCRCIATEQCLRAGGATSFHAWPTPSPLTSSIHC